MAEAEGSIPFVSTTSNLLEPVGVPAGSFVLIVFAPCLGWHGGARDGGAMDIVAATEHDLPVVERLYRDVADEMNGAPHDVWWDFGVHPTHEGLLEAARSGNLFVAVAQAPEEQLFGDEPECEAGRPVAGLGCKPSVLGAFVLDARQGTDYSLAPWLVDAPSGRVAVIHLLAVAPGARGRGVGRALLRAAVREARSRGAWSLRLDVFDNNAPAISAYRRAGFADFGIFDIEVGGGLRHPSHLMELDLRETDEKR